MYSAKVFMICADAAPGRERIWPLEQDANFQRRRALFSTPPELTFHTGFQLVAHMPLCRWNGSVIRGYAQYSIAGTRMRAAKV